MGYGEGNTWSQWLVDDQREASGRPDVVAFVSDVLTAPARISGEPVANLIASTSGTDSDWVVKLIDIYPDEVAGDAVMGGYQLMVAADIFRGRYRESFETAKPLAPDVPLLYKFALPTANHVFRPGHRIMVQVQSSWFPLYDRKPADVRAEHLLGEAGGFPEGDATGLPRARPEQLRRATPRNASLSRTHNRIGFSCRGHIARGLFVRNAVPVGELNLVARTGCLRLSSPVGRPLSQDEGVLARTEGTGQTIRLPGVGDWFDEATHVSRDGFRSGGGRNRERQPSEGLRPRLATAALPGRTAPRGRGSSPGWGGGCQPRACAPRRLSATASELGWCRFGCPRR